jgi:hypothetical protein
MKIMSQYFNGGLHINRCTQPYYCDDVTEMLQFMHHKELIQRSSIEIEEHVTPMHYLVY